MRQGEGDMLSQETHAGGLTSAMQIRYMGHAHPAEVAQPLLTRPLTPQESIRDRYIELLRRHLRDQQESILLDVYELGREAMACELSLISMVELHHRALLQALSETPMSRGYSDTFSMAEVMLSELLAPYAMSHLGQRQINASMQHLNDTLEKEVRRIAHAIHDDAGQLLACVHLSLYDIGREAPAELKPKLEETRQLLDQLEAHLRNISHELRPRVLENSGLADAIRFLAEGIARRAGLRIEVVADLLERAPPAIETAVYRCVHEMLNNVIKHARASAVSIRLFREDGMLKCAVVDDGIGFDARDAFLTGSGNQLGLVGILERISVLHGTVEIDSSPGQGAVVEIAVPES